MWVFTFGGILHMTELNLYDTNVLLIGEPTCMIGVVLIYLLCVIEVMFVGTWSLIFTMAILRKLL